jgi:hypothetical protein
MKTLGPLPAVPGLAAVPFLTRPFNFGSASMNVQKALHFRRASAMMHSSSGLPDPSVFWKLRMNFRCGWHFICCSPSAPSSSAAVALPCWQQVGGSCPDFVGLMTGSSRWLGSWERCCCTNTSSAVFRLSFGLIDDDILDFVRWNVGPPQRDVFRFLIQ